MYDADDEDDDTSIRAVYSLEEWEKEKAYEWSVDFIGL